MRAQREKRPYRRPRRAESWSRPGTLPRLMSLAVALLLCAAAAPSLTKRVCSRSARQRVFARPPPRLALTSRSILRSSPPAHAWRSPDRERPWPDRVPRRRSRRDRPRGGGNDRIRADHLRVPRDARSRVGHDDHPPQAGVQGRRVSHARHFADPSRTGRHLRRDPDRPRLPLRRRSQRRVCQRRPRRRARRDLLQRRRSFQRRMPDRLRRSPSVRGREPPAGRRG